MNGFGHAVCPAGSTSDDRVIGAVWTALHRSLPGDSGTQCALAIGVGGGGRLTEPELLRQKAPAGTTRTLSFATCRLGA